jgi:predicted ATPase
MEMVLFLGAYRDNELQGNHPLTEPIRKLESRKCSSRMHIVDLTLDSLNTFIATLLKYEDYPDVTVPLSKSIHQRTRGNIFFVLQFLEMLVSGDILQYSFNTMKWQWDEEQLFEQTGATENVTDLVIRRMRRLPPNMALALIVASHLGNRFDAQVVKLVLAQWKESESLDHSFQILDMADEKETDELDFLDIPIREGFIVPVESVAGGKWFRFLHDRIQQAASGLIGKESEKRVLQFRLGTLLLGLSQETDKTWTVLSGVDLLNTVQDLVVSKPRRLALVEANIKAAKIAATQSAFAAAGDYLKHCRSLMNTEELWGDHYQLALMSFTKSRLDVENPRIRGRQPTLQ